MHYYLPISINNRRIHICKLQEDYVPDNCFEFIIHKSADNVIFSIPVDGAALISTEGYVGKNGNVRLETLMPVLTYDADERQCRLDLYDRRFRKPERSRNMRQPVEIINHWGRRNFAIITDHTLMPAPTTFTFTICYHRVERHPQYGEREREFTYSFVTHYCQLQQVKQAALDFGSEASQVRVHGDRMNVPLVNLLEGNFYNGEKTGDYWQGKQNDLFFKSVFFIHRDPQRPINEADAPNLYGERNFVQSLVTKTADLSQRFILPNLKLLDAIDSPQILNQPIHLDSSEEDAISRKNINPVEANLGSESVPELVLEILLNNFLHCILKKLNSGTGPAFLRLNVLMPNVYPQSKVYQVVKGLYAGFNAMKSDYPYFQGVEIQVLSESDAAFLGARTISRWSINGQELALKSKSKGYFLVIDAGKGTTDFSILRQQENQNCFDSVYRGGIPISGNAITYAFYEAVRDYCNQYGYTLNDKLQDALEDDRGRLLQFVDILEKLKCNYTQCRYNAGDMPNYQAGFRLENLIAHFNDTIIPNRQKLPHTDLYVNAAVDHIVEWVTTELNRYCKEHSVLFEQVMFTGRGFLFQPFRQAMETKLREMGVMGPEANVLCHDDDQAKSICLLGSFLLGTSNNINENSEMVGYPVVVSESKSSSFLSKLFRSNVADEKFFYNGLRITDSQPTIQVSGSDYTARNRSPKEKRLLFVGDTFMLQYADMEAEFFTEKSHYAHVNEVNRSLFPFFAASIPDKEVLGDIPTPQVAPPIVEEESEPLVPKAETKPAAQPEDGDIF